MTKTFVFVRTMVACSGAAMVAGFSWASAGCNRTMPLPVTSSLSHKTVANGEKAMSRILKSVECRSLSGTVIVVPPDLAAMVTKELAGFDWTRGFNHQIEKNGPKIAPDYRLVLKYSDGTEKALSVLGMNGLYDDTTKRLYTFESGPDLTEWYYKRGKTRNP